MLQFLTKKMSIKLINCLEFPSLKSNQEENQTQIDMPTPIMERDSPQEAYESPLTKTLKQGEFIETEIPIERELDTHTDTRRDDSMNAIEVICQGVMISALKMDAES